MLSKNMRNILFLVLITGFIAAACSSKTTIRPGDSLELAFEKSMMVFEQGNYSQAARNFELVLSIGRGTELARQAQFLLAESYFNSRQFVLAAAEYRRYYTNFPRSDRRVDAEFREALSYYRLSPRFKLDQQDTYRAIERFQLFIQRYPETELSNQAREYIAEMREKLAKKEFHSAELYLRLRQYRAAALSYDMVIDRFPETSWAEKALMRQILAYTIFAENSVEERQQERFEKAIASYQKYLQLFPRGPHRADAEAHYNRAMNGLGEVMQLTSR